MNWNILQSEQQLEDLKKNSALKPQVIFKHSNRCSISSMTRARLERSDEPIGLDFHFLDLIAHRGLSNKIAEDFNIEHESPQVLVIKNGKCVYDESHNAISMDELASQAT